MPGIYKLSNGISPASVRSLDSNKKVNSLYGMISWAYQNSIFLDLTARNDCQVPCHKIIGHSFTPQLMQV